MILCMPGTVGPQQRYDHRLRDLVYRTRDVTLATDQWPSAAAVRVAVNALLVALIK